MKPSLFAATAVAAAALLSSPAVAGEITSIHSVQTNLAVDGTAVKNERLPSTFSSAGENLTVTLGGLGAGTAGTAVATTADSSLAVTTAGAPYSYAASAFAGSSASSMTPTISNSNGVLTALGAADVQTVNGGGVAGTLAATNLGTGIATITAGGIGTQATITRSNTLSAF